MKIKSWYEDVDKNDPRTEEGYLPDEWQKTANKLKEAGKTGFEDFDEVFAEEMSWYDARPLITEKITNNIDIDESELAMHASKFAKPDLQKDASDWNKKLQEFKQKVGTVTPEQKLRILKNKIRLKKEHHDVIESNKYAMLAEQVARIVLFGHSKTPVFNQEKDAQIVIPSEYDELFKGKDIIADIGDDTYLGIDVTTLDETDTTGRYAAKLKNIEQNVKKDGLGNIILMYDGNSMQTNVGAVETVVSLPSETLETYKDSLIQAAGSKEKKPYSKRIAENLESIRDIVFSQIRNQVQTNIRQIENSIRRTSNPKIKKKYQTALENHEKVLNFVEERMKQEIPKESGNVKDTVTKGGVIRRRSV